MPKIPCARPGCPTLVSEGGIHGYCDVHDADAIVETLGKVSEQLENVTGHLDENTEYLARINGKIDDLAPAGTD